MIDLDAIEKEYVNTMASLSLDSCWNTRKHIPSLIARVRELEGEIKEFEDARELAVLAVIRLRKRIAELQATCAQQNSQILILETAWKLFDAARQEEGFCGGGSTVWIDSAKRELGNV